MRQFRRLAGKKSLLLAMVKANAYGHGMIPIARLAIETGADWLGVHSLEEGICLRRESLTCPILVSGYVPLNRLEEAVEGGLRLTVYNRESVRKLKSICRRLGKSVRLHLKVETGTYRQGIPLRNVFSFADEIRKGKGLILEGISSHFANIEDTTDHSYARYQKKNFQEVIDELEAGGFDIPIKHMSCTAAAILFPETYFNMIRTGIGIYGLWPSKETYLSCLLQKRRPLSLKPVLTWKARIAQIKKVPSGSLIGYGCTYKTTRKTTLAVVPVGYYDGYSRRLSNQSYVLVKGIRAPLRGRVAMDFIVIDVTDIPGVKQEDEVVLIGRNGEEAVTADFLASLEGTINYEIVTRINPGIPRIIV